MASVNLLPIAESDAQYTQDYVDSVSDMFRNEHYSSSDEYKAYYSSKTILKPESYDVCLGVIVHSKNEYGRSIAEQTVFISRISNTAVFLRHVSSDSSLNIRDQETKSLTTYDETTGLYYYLDDIDSHPSLGITFTTPTPGESLAEVLAAADAVLPMIATQTIPVQFVRQGGGTVRQIRYHGQTGLILGHSRKGVA